MLPRSIEDINTVARYTYFIVCLDAEEEEVDVRLQEVLTCVATSPVTLDPSVTTRVIVQKRSVETWLLGNKTIYPRNPTGEEFQEFARHYNVSTHDPELMGLPADCMDNHAQYHHAYLKAMFRERNIRYTKQNPGHASDQSYLNQLVQRVRAANAAHLATLRVFLDLCENIHQLTSGEGS